MKKVLILAYDFPPYVSVGGLRPKAWLENLKKSGVEPVIVTRQWDNLHGNHLDYVAPSSSKKTQIEHKENGIIIRTAYRPNLSNRLLLNYGESRFKLIRKAISAFYEIGQYLLPIGTKKELYKAARTFISENKVDCILATGDPFVLFHYGKKLSSEFNIPWIADYRDPWSHEFENNGSLFQRKWSRFLEKKIVLNAAAISTVSELLKIKIHQVTGHPKIEVFPNGFDSDAIAKVRDIKQNSTILKIGFAGSIFFWNPIDNFLKTISEFINEHPHAKLELHFYGVNIENELSEKINGQFANLQTCTHIYPRIPNQQLLEKLANCNALLLFNHYSILGTKIFDYIGLRRKILLCYTANTESKQLKSRYFPLEEIQSESNKLQEELIAKTNSGIALRDELHLKETLAEMLREFNSTGKIHCDSKNIENYSRQIQTEKLAELIKSIC
jgi:hypothetical protein